MSKWLDMKKHNYTYNICVKLGDGSFIKSDNFCQPCTTLKPILHPEKNRISLIYYSMHKTHQVCTSTVRHRITLWNSGLQVPLWFETHFRRNNHVTATEFNHTTLQFVNKRSTNRLNGRVFVYKLNSCEIELRSSHLN